MLLCAHYAMRQLARLNLNRACAVGARAFDWVDGRLLALCRRKVASLTSKTTSTRRCCLPLARMRSRRCGRVAPDDIRQVLKLVTEHLKEVEDLNRNRHDVGPITGISAPVKRHAVSSSLPDIDVRCRTHSHASAVLYPRPSADARSRYLGPSLRFVTLLFNQFSHRLPQIYAQIFYSPQHGPHRPP